MRQHVAPQRDAGRLDAVDAQAPVGELAGRAPAAAVLPAFMQVPTRATTGTPRVSSGGFAGSGSGPMRAGRPMRSPSTGKLSTAPSTSPSKGLAEVGVDRLAEAEHAAQVEQVHAVAGRQPLRDPPGVAEQRVAVAEAAGDDVAAAQLRHAARGQLELVVDALVVEDPHGDHEPLAHGISAAEPRLRA